MDTTLVARPLGSSECGFCFTSNEAFEAWATQKRNDHGKIVEAFEFEIVDGDVLDEALAKAWKLKPDNIAAYFEAVEEWDICDKELYIVAVRECGYWHFDVIDDLDSIELDIYAVGSLKELAEQFVDEGVYGDIPDTLQSYIDYDAIARDLAVDFSETMIAGERLVYACR